MGTQVVRNERLGACCCCCLGNDLVGLGLDGPGVAFCCGGGGLGLGGVAHPGVVCELGLELDFPVSLGGSGGLSSSDDEFESES